MSLHYLIYVSSAARPMTAPELIELLEQSRDKNARLDITGMLLYKNGNFMQMLEGERDVVHDLYATICADERHFDVYTIVARDVEARSFPDWSMGFSDMNEALPEQPFSAYFDNALNSATFRDDADFARRFIVSFNANN